MEQIEVSESSKLPNQTDLGTSNSLVSELIPAYLMILVQLRDGRHPLEIGQFPITLIHETH